MREFDQFWTSYPRHIRKLEAQTAFKRALHKTDLDTMLRALAWQMESDQWRRGVIPSPATWLRQERWSDEPSRPLGHKAQEIMREEMTAAERERIAQHQHKASTEYLAELKKKYPTGRIR